ncbi:MAG: phage protease [Bacteroidota bacterium]
MIDSSTTTDSGIAADTGTMIRIVPVGNFPVHHNGGHEVTPLHILEMASNFEAGGTDLLIDVDHESLWGRTRAAGWSSRVEARPDGLYMEYPTWTPQTEELVNERAYRYFSPVYTLSSTDKQGGQVGARLLSVALTNMPYMDTEIEHVGNASGGPAGKARGGSFAASHFAAPLVEVSPGPRLPGARVPGARPPVLANQSSFDKLVAERRRKRDQALAKRKQRVQERAKLLEKAKSLVESGKADSLAHAVKQLTS